MERKICLICGNKMVIVLNTPTVPNKEIVFKMHWKCKKCGVNVYKTNILELAEEDLQKEINKRK